MEYSLSTAGSVTNRYLNLNSLLKDSVPNNQNIRGKQEIEVRSNWCRNVPDLRPIVRRVPIKRDGSNPKCSGFVDGSTWPKLQQISFYYCDRY